jgi:hypothetical protein
VSGAATVLQWGQNMQKDDRIVGHYCFVLRLLTWWLGALIPSCRMCMWLDGRSYDTSFADKYFYLCYEGPSRRNSLVQLLV